MGTFCLIKFVPAIGTTLLGAIDASAIDGGTEKLKAINKALDEVKKATQNCKNITQAGNECVENMHSLGAKTTDMVEKGASWLGNASGLEITLMVIVFVMLIAMGFIFFKMYGMKGGLDCLKNRYGDEQDEPIADDDEEESPKEVEQMV